jgi:hypothetical protein
MKPKIARVCSDQLAHGSSPDVSAMVESDSEIDCSGLDCAWDPVWAELWIRIREFETDSHPFR